MAKTQPVTQEEVESLTREIEPLVLDARVLADRMTREIPDYSYLPDRDTIRTWMRVAREATAIVMALDAVAEMVMQKRELEALKKERGL